MSDKTVAEKLLIRPETSVWFSHPDRASLVQPLPDGVQVVAAPRDATVALAFADDSGSIRALLADRVADLRQPEILWVAYPKGGRADINRDTLWPILAEYAFRPVSQVAVDDTWSALRFRPLREGEAQFSGGRT